MNLDTRVSPEGVHRRFTTDYISMNCRGELMLTLQLSTNLTFIGGGR